jgi:hypothetical protein
MKQTATGLRFSAPPFWVAALLLLASLHVALHVPHGHASSPNHAPCAICATTQGAEVPPADAGEKFLPPVEVRIAATCPDHEIFLHQISFKPDAPRGPPTISL